MIEKKNRVQETGFHYWHQIIMAPNGFIRAHRCASKSFCNWHFVWTLEDG
jgi:hypothetical protein